MNHLTKYERTQFYRDHPDYKLAMLYFMEIEKGIRCLALRPDPTFSKVPYVYRDNSKPGYALMQLTTENFDYYIKYARTIQFLAYIFDKRVLECESIDDLRSRKYVIGVTPVIDIDAPPIDPEDKSKGRQDVIDYLPEIAKFVVQMEEELVEMDEKHTLYFSGNGFYMILDNYYPDKSLDKSKQLEDIDLFIDKLNETIDDAKQISNYEHVDTGKYRWMQNYKPPYTFHYEIPGRISVPVPSELNSVINYAQTKEN